MQLHFRTTPSEGALADPALESGGLSRSAPLSIHLHERIEPLEAQWRALEAQNDISLHQGYDWCAAWARTNVAEVLILEGVSGGTTQFILPLEIRRHGPMRIARLLATDFSNLNTGLHTPAFRALVSPPELRQALKQARSQFARHFDLLLLDKMPLEWRGAANPFADLPAALNQNAAFQLPLLGDFERTLAQVNAKSRRKKFRHAERRLIALGGYEHTVGQTPEEALELLETFFRQKAVRFEALGLPDVFRDEETRDFFRTLAAAPASEETYPLRLHALRLKGENEGHIAAIAGLSRKGDHVICQFGSLDESIAAGASPGEFLFHLIIRQLCDEGVSLFDFGVGDQLYKRSWCTIETQQYDFLWPTTSAGRVAAALHRATTGAKRFIKQNPQIYAFLQRLRSGRQAARAGNDAD